MDEQPIGKGWVIMAGIALAGGVARQAHQWLGGKKVTRRHFIARAAISLFIGGVCYHVFPVNAPWTYGVCGLLSWLGADGVSLLIQLAFKQNDNKHE